MKNTITQCIEGNRIEITGQRINFTCATVFYDDLCENGVNVDHLASCFGQRADKIGWLMKLQQKSRTANEPT